MPPAVIQRYKIWRRFHQGPTGKREKRGAGKRKGSGREAAKSSSVEKLPSKELGGSSGTVFAPATVSLEQELPWWRKRMQAKEEEKAVEEPYCVLNVTLAPSPTKKEYERERESSIPHHASSASKECDGSERYHQYPSIQAKYRHMSLMRYGRQLFSVRAAPIISQRFK